MLPKVIIHNSVSIDGSLTDFEVNLMLHYQIAGSFEADMNLVGSNTAKTGMDLFMQKIPKETKKDFKKPFKSGILWAIPDSGGKLQGLLHVLRRSEYCKDVIIFVSKSTPENYLDYLSERDYTYHISGKKHCDLQKVLELLNSIYGAKKILTDTGSILGNILLEKDLASELSLLVHPFIVGEHSYNMFGNITKDLKLRLIRKELLEKEYVWLLYRVNR